ncbi:MAG: 3-hydroxyacyl-CoA dehydrogenase family protein [Deltaproteobacteria bacterium]|nr:3-hydroxyacyl-CoA dehydrogenase family protein [Deltaproteobacteria bacterium]
MVRTAAVIGAGTIGASIGQLLAHAGVQVSLHARRAETLTRARERIRAGLDLFADEQLLTTSEAKAALDRIRATQDLTEAVRGAEFVMEAVTEDPEIKRGVYAAMGHAVGPDALVASTTSGLNIYELAPSFPNPARLIIAHFWNPPHLIPLVEVVPGPQTSAEAIRATETLMRELGRTPVTMKAFVPGFIGVRLQSALFREALALINQGVVGPAEIDAVMREAIALRLPVLDIMEVADFGGLDTFRRVWQHMFPLLTSSGELPGCVRDRVERGELGLKSGRGFHDYHGENQQALLRERDRKLLRWLKERDRYRLKRGNGGTR